ncbi:MAG: NAD(P)-dependent oxidoreductase [Alphaproteobacteria bacterium]|nr:NAD(P)-dependent oxidoreductase [Alphaproteobacteria bacterium]
MKPDVDLSRYRIGLIGTGLMGTPMARRLAAAGARLAVWNRTIETAELLAAELPNTEPVPSPRHAADGSDIVVVMVTDADAVETVVFDPMDDSYGAAHGIGDGGLIIDMSTTDVTRTRGFADRLRARGAEWMDAPVSGGTTAAEDGTLSIMVGGSDGGFARAEPMFRVLGARITHVGAVGAGQIAKTANQMIVGMTIGAVAEAFALARSAGVEPGAIREAILGGFAQSRILELHGERMVNEDFQARARSTIQLKDMRAAASLAEAVGIDLPGLTTNLGLWERLIEDGAGDLDHSALILAVDPIMTRDD